jgi:glycosyltransferase involved in cell wall biosynthesis
VKILLAGPLETASLGDALGIDLSALPKGTVQTPVVPLATGLFKAGHSLEIVTTDTSISRVIRFERDGLSITFCPLRGEPHYRARVRSRDLFAQEIAYLKKIFETSSADIIHAHWTYEFAEAAIRSKRPMVATMHDLGWDCLFNFRDLYRAVRLLMKIRALIRVPFLTAVSPYAARKAWQYGYFGAVRVIPNPIETTNPKNKFLDHPVIVTVGNNGRLKNVAASVKAFHSIRSTHPSAELHLFGSGLGSEYEFAREEGVFAHGAVPHADLMRFLSDNATVLVHPSRTESWGVILAEAKMRGVPVVAGRNSGGVSYVVGDVGALVDIEDPSQIANATLKILSDQEKYSNMQMQGHQDVVARFSTEVVVKQYEEVYQNILSS